MLVEIAEIFMDSFMLLLTIYVCVDQWFARTPDALKYSHLNEMTPKGMLKMTKNGKMNFIDLIYESEKPLRRHSITV